MNDIDTILQEEAVSQGVDAHLPILRKLVSAESGGSATATSPKGAMGVMQLMPETAAGLGVTDPYDVRQNIRGGVKYWKQMLDRYNGNPVLASAAYNAGPGNVDKHGGIPPFTETVNYINKLFGKVASIFTPQPKDISEKDDDGTAAYISRRQEAHEEGSEANKLLQWYDSQYGQKAKQQLQQLPEENLEPSPELARIPAEEQAKIANQSVRAGDVSPQEAKQASIPTPGQEAVNSNPWIDPVNVLAAAGGGWVAMGAKSAIQGLIGNIAGEIAGGTLGQTIEEQAPKWAWVAALALDVATGMAVDKAINAATKRIKLSRPDISDDEAQKIAQSALEAPEIKQGLVDLQNIPPEKLEEQKTFLERIANRVNEFVADESGSMPGGGPRGKKPLDVPIEDIVSPKIPDQPQQLDIAPITGKAGSSIVEVAESQGRIGGKFARQRRIEPASDNQVKQFLGGDFPDLLQDKAININLNRIESPEDIKETIGKIGQMYSGGIQEARRHTISLEQTQKLADDMGLTVENLLKRRSGEAFNAEEAVAARRILVTSATELKSLATKVMGPEASEIDMTAFRKQLAVHAAIQEQVSGMTAEAGRALSSFRILANSQEGIAKQINEMLTMTGGTKTAKDIAKALHDFDTLQQVNDFARRAYKAKTSDVLLEAWINALLSGPQTHAVNSTSNALTALWQIPERILAAGISKLSGNEAVYAGEATAQFYGMISGFKDALRLAGKALASGESSDMFSKIDVPRPKAISKETFNVTGAAGQAIDLLGNVIRIPSRFLTAEDEFFKGIGYRMELQAQAYRTARNEGLTGKEMANRIQEIISDPPEHISAAAIDAARYQTFTKPLGEFGQSVVNSVNKLPALRLIMPFISTPANIFKFTMERTPLAPLLSEVRADVMAGGARRDMALARMSLGSMVMATTATMAASGYITGRGPIDPELNSSLRRTGWQPYSVKIGDKYYAYNRLEPLGSILGMAADYAEIAGQIGQEDAGKLAAASIMTISKNITSKTFLRGLSDFMAVMDNPDRQGVRYLQSLTGTLIPTGVAQISRAMDPVRRETKGQERTGEVDRFGKLKTESDWILDNWRSRIPGMSEDLPPARNLWGDKIYYPPGLGPDLISPIRVTEKIKSPIDEEMIRNEIKVEKPTKQIDGVPLNAHEYDRYVVLAGRAAEEKLNELVETPGYKQLSDGPDGGKAWMVRKYIQIERELAKQQVLQEFPELQQIIVNHKVQRYQKIAGQ